jgi:endonuclease/exonuclease/phosphatase (EEP) superfamily protein YafD
LQALLRLVTAAGIALGFGATAAGMLAPWIPYLELVNHFRPFLLVAAAALAGLAFLVGQRFLRLASAGFLALTLVLFLAPLATLAHRADGDAASLRIVTLNLWVRNTNVDAVAQFLRAERADVVLLQEADRSNRALAQAVRDVYPHVYCPDRTCSLALLSREPWAEAGKADVFSRRPLAVWARFDRAGHTVEVMGVHVAYPYHPEAQQRHVTWLIEQAGTRPHPLIIAGDFNLSPFSWKLNRLLFAGALRRHVTWSFSWPAQRWLPFVLLDNVLSTPDFATVSARTGPRLGSDHLPVIVDLAFVKR